MARICHFCKKRPQAGNIISHSNIKTKTRRLPNIQKVRAVVSGITQRVYACTRCIRSGVVTKPIPRTYKAPTAEAAEA